MRECGETGRGEFGHGDKGYGGGNNWDRLEDPHRNRKRSTRHPEGKGGVRLKAKHASAQVPVGGVRTGS